MPFSKEKFFHQKSVLITGGAGFLGSNLALALVENGARVTVIDSFHPDYGANEFNLAGILKSVELVRGDIRDRELIKKSVSSADIIFHLAAQCSHVDSMVDPWFDLEMNCAGILNLLEAAKARFDQAKKAPLFVYAGTRAMLGAPQKLPANESTLPNPTDVYGVNKLAAEMYGAVYARVHGIPFVSLRLTNCFGPRHQMKSGKYGILNWFVSLVLQSKALKIFGEGRQLRDYLYVDDAVEAFLSAAKFAENLRDGLDIEKNKPVLLAGEKIPFAAFNIASGRQIPFVEAAKLVAKIGNGRLETVPWPADRAAIETGDYVAETVAANQILQWSAQESFQDGLEKTFEYYRKNLSHYV